MANLYRKAKEAVEATDFRYVPNIEQLSDEELQKHGYYRGFTCMHNHEIRDVSQHWCHFCVKKIISNVCGFDINYIQPEYKAKYQKLWAKINIGSTEDCWEIESPGVYTPKRVCLPSYRSFYSKQKAENVTIHKALYQCAWGDIGSQVVTRICGNPRCGNPLHLVSSWNRLFPPDTIHPFCITFEPEKLMLYTRRLRDPILSEHQFKKTICNPLEHKETEE